MTSFDLNGDSLDVPRDRFGRRQFRAKVAARGARRTLEQALGERSNDMGMSNLVNALICAAAILGGIVAGSADAADPQLDQALQALQKAEALVLASQAGLVPPKVESQFDRHTMRAVDAIQRAMDQIEAAQGAVDNP